MLAYIADLNKPGKQLKYIFYTPDIEKSTLLCP